MVQIILSISTDPAQPPPPPREFPPPTEEERAFLAKIDRILAGEEPPPLMTTPPEVEKIVNETMAQFDKVSPEDWRRLADELNLGYYYGGQEVLTWKTPQGVAVLAVGMEQAALVARHLSADKLLEVLTQFPQPWLG